MTVHRITYGKEPAHCPRIVGYDIPCVLVWPFLSKHFDVEEERSNHGTARNACVTKSL